MNAGESAGGNRKIVAHEVELGELCLFGKIELVRMGNANFASLDGQNFGCVFLRHRNSLTVTRSTNPYEL